MHPKNYVHGLSSQHPGALGPGTLKIQWGSCEISPVGSMDPPKFKNLFCFSVGIIPKWNLSKLFTFYEIYYILYWASTVMENVWKRSQKIKSSEYFSLLSNCSCPHPMMNVVMPFVECTFVDSSHWSRLDHNHNWRFPPAASIQHMWYDFGYIYLW